MLLRCAANDTAKSTAVMFNVNVRTVEGIFTEFREYCSALLDTVPFQEGEVKEIDEFAICISQL